MKTRKKRQNKSESVDKQTRKTENLENNQNLRSSEKQKLNTFDNNIKNKKFDKDNINELSNLDQMQKRQKIVIKNQFNHIYFDEKPEDVEKNVKELDSIALNESINLGLKIKKYLKSRNSIEFSNKINELENANKIIYSLDHKLITEIILDLLQEQVNNQDKNGIKISKQAINIMHSTLERHVIFIFETAEKIKKNKSITIESITTVHNLAKQFDEYIEINENLHEEFKN